MSTTTSCENGICEFRSGVSADIRERFRQEWVVYALRVSLTEVASLRRALASRHLLRLPRKPSVVRPWTQSVLASESALFCCDILPRISRQFIRSPRTAISLQRMCPRIQWHWFKCFVRSFASRLGSEIPERLSRALTTSLLSTYRLQLDYDYFGHSYILRQLLPSSVPAPKSFETIGHVLHLNLRDVHRPYRQLIGEVLREKIPGVELVVNKAANVGGTFRTFAIEVLAAVPNYRTQVSLRENGCLFHLDISRVYWNSRLETEHRRLIDTITARHSDFVAAKVQKHPTAPSMPLADVVIVDAFAGVGPFSIPLAKRGFSVYANDLNPDAISYLEQNIAANNLVRARCQTSCMDARAFLEDVIQKKHLPVQHIIMNLPADAVSFLDVLVGHIAPHKPLPFVYCYCFGRGEDAQDEIIERITQILDDAWQRQRKGAIHPFKAFAEVSTEAPGTLSDAKRYRPEPFRFDSEKDQLRIRCVRHVAPEKFMFCVEFQFPERLARSKTAFS
ncbi:tRNA(m(1)G37)methyltransferase [Cyanidiococcus yangmingshanensis]|uniref:tRNA (guanine(37)-N1)-methyltransferase n=1 Tax=Cyanidiococcus yangmingshanensis TaxID=2690220 RepID=A0A7J7IN11_9RHOD|nr:tRNA(m(1)G37)methyltransferase [Cyanidiococcus yangmingshanensis]